MNGPLEWFAAIGTMIAAGLIAADLGRRATGWGFVLFVVVAISWVVAGLTSDPPAYPLAVMNGILLCINAWGVWQFLLNPKKKREIEMVEQCAADVHEQLEADEGEPKPHPREDGDLMPSSRNLPAA
jgi:hypothetical protein